MKISGYLQKKIIPNGILINIILITLGFGLFSYIINNKIIEGNMSLIIIGVAYFITGVGFFGLFRWLLINGFKIVVYLIRLILLGNIEVVITKDKVNFKTNLSKK